nr:hypothetical protein BaRGS_024730 [Batillaria attramentaria]
MAEDNVFGSPDPTEPVRIGEKVNVTCDPGYYLDGNYSLVCTSHLDYDNTVPVCRDIDECASEEDNPCGIHACQNLAGGYRCLCNAGYQHPGEDETTCADIDECTRENGGCSQQCHNLDGGYECQCGAGQRLYEGFVIVINGAQLVPGKSCIATCPPLSVAAGTVAYRGSPLPDGDYMHPTKAIIICPPGFIPDGPAEYKNDNSNNNNNNNKKH